MTLVSLPLQSNTEMIYILLKFSPNFRESSLPQKFWIAIAVNPQFHTKTSQNLKFRHEIRTRK